MTHTDYIKNAHLPGDDFFWGGNDTGILLIHGFTATTAEVRPLAEKLHQAGFTTAGPLLPGHGTHPDDMNKSSWQLWLQKVHQTFDEITASCKRTFVVGESMGAVLALALATQQPEIAGLLLFAPAIKVVDLWKARWVSPFIPYIKKQAGDDGLPWKGYTVSPMKAAVQLLKLQKHTLKHLPAITQPTWVFTGEYDQTISPESAEIILQGIRSSHKCHIHMKNSAHCILLDQELDLVTEHVLSFINA